MKPGQQQQRRSSRQTEEDKTPYSLRRESGLSLEERIQALVAEMRVCLAEKRAVNLSNPPHTEITEALHRFVYDESDEPAELDVIYNDTPIEKKRAPFPVRALSSPPARPDWRREKVQATMVNIGTLSFRHVAYDDYVDFYLMRDRETRTMTSLDIQDVACSRMGQILDDPAFADESYITLYQTGLEPLVVGVYRAVVQHLRKRRANGLPPLFIRPVYYANEKGVIDFGRTYWA